MAIHVGHCYLAPAILVAYPFLRKLNVSLALLLKKEVVLFPCSSHLQRILRLEPMKARPTSGLAFIGENCLVLLLMKRLANGDC